jgi:hypothetical protein
MSKAKSGGGITMNKNVTGRVTPGAKNIDVVAPGSAGAAKGTKLVMTQARDAAPMGNEIAINSKAGPGAGRTVRATGSQGLHSGTKKG